jgi:hypothetical protein
MYTAGLSKDGFALVCCEELDEETRVDGIAARLVAMPSAGVGDGRAS